MQLLQVQRKNNGLQSSNSIIIKMNNKLIQFIYHNMMRKSVGKLINIILYFNLKELYYIIDSTFFCFPFNNILEFALLYSILSKNNDTPRCRIDFLHSMDCG